MAAHSRLIIFTGADLDEWAPAENKDQYYGYGKLGIADDFIAKKYYDEFLR